MTKPEDLPTFLQNNSNTYSFWNKTTTVRRLLISKLTEIDSEKTNIGKLHENAIKKKSRIATSAECSVK